MTNRVAVGQDPLTGLPQYDAFLALFEAAITEADNTGGAVSMALMDIDWFDKLNKDRGSGLGDAVLKALAGFLEATFSDRGKVFRYGGDAFAVLLAGTEKEEAFLLAEEARRAFEGEHEIETEDGKKVLAVPFTTGVAAYPDDGAAAHDIMRKANEAVYRGKVGGRNKVCLAREEKMVTKTSHYTQGQLQGLSRLSKRMGVGEAVLLREALDDLLRKYNA